jgi:H+/Cl- antiporter ClcA
VTPEDDPHPHLRDEASTDALPVSPALGASLDAARMPRRSTLVEPRVLFVCALAALLGVAAAFIARILVALISLVTNAAFYGRWSIENVQPAAHHLGAWVIVVPVIGGLIVGLMARWGSRAIRGHGIPEAMEQVLLNESKIPPRITFLQPV